MVDCLRGNKYLCKVKRAISRYFEGMPAINGKENIMIKEEREFLCDDCVNVDYCTTFCKIQEQLNENVALVREESE